MIGLIFDGNKNVHVETQLLNAQGLRPKVDVYIELFFGLNMRLCQLGEGVWSYFDNVT